MASSSSVQLNAHPQLARAGRQRFLPHSARHGFRSEGSAENAWVIAIHLSMGGWWWVHSSSRERRGEGNWVEDSQTEALDSRYSRI